MSISALVYQRLTGYSGITAIASGRTYPMLLPQTPTYPALTYQRISNSGQNGTSALRESRWQIDCFARTYAETVSLAAQVKAAFEEWHDLDQTPGILMARVVNELEDYDSDTDVYRVVVDVMLTTTGD